MLLLIISLYMLLYVVHLLARFSMILEDGEEFETSYKQFLSTKGKRK